MAATVSVSVPIWLTLIRIELAMFFVDALLQELGVGDEQIVAHQLHPLAEPLRQQRPAVPVVLAHAVFDGDDRIAADQAFEIVGELRRGELTVLGLEVIDAVLEELGAGHVEAEEDLLAGLVAGAIDGFENGLQRRFVGRQVRRETALIAHRGRELALVQDLLERVEDFRAVAQRFGQRRRADRQDHELLDVDAVIGMRAAVDDVHHRHRQRLGAAEAAEQRLFGFLRHRVRGGERHGEQRIGAEARLGLGAVELDHFLVDRRPGRRHRGPSTAS